MGKEDFGDNPHLVSDRRSAISNAQQGASEHTPGPWRCDTAPHDCGDPTCPGVINKRKLEAFDDMLALLQAVLIDIEGPQPGMSEWAMKVRAAIAKATEVRS